MDEILTHKHKRPSVLRHVPQTASRQQHDSKGSSFLCKEEVDTCHLPWSNSTLMLSTSPNLYFLSSSSDHPKQPSIKTRLNNW
ncbi:hypothetical protein ATANTOWER_021305 [Ataeniobius toweri]|uniref:Uncharacterized protein n=1 Tax=Ataeniobius toweri TaxID=208326 RepID=A0ABU7AGD6_9TELE|nr:hypothetical protein [Ataeniobius toweri]